MSNITYPKNNYSIYKKYNNNDNKSLLKNLISICFEAKKIGLNISSVYNINGNIKLSIDEISYEFSDKLESKIFQLIEIIKGKYYATLV